MGLFCQNQYIEDQIAISSLKNTSQNKIFKWIESFGWDNTKKSCESLIFIVAPWEKEISFYRKGKEEKIFK